jgi:23S rRNA pseudoU1915 N3-methylase RlmH
VSLKKILAVAAAIAVSACPGLAQSSMGSSPESGSLITRRAAQISGKTTTDARRTTRDYGVCVLKRFPKYGERVALEPVHTDEYQKLLKRMVIDDCLSLGELTFPLNVVRSAVIEALYFNEYGRGGPTDFSQVPPIDYLAGYPAELPGNARTTLALAKFGDCVSRKDSVNARALAVSIPGSADETQRFRFLSPSFNGCVVQGEKLTFSKSVIRGAVAEGLYRLSRAADQPAVGTAAGR